MLATQRNGVAKVVLKTQEQIQGYQRNPSLIGKYNLTPYEVQVSKSKPIKLVEPTEAKQSEQDAGKTLSGKEAKKGGQ